MTPKTKNCKLQIKFSIFWNNLIGNNSTIISLITKINKPINVDQCNGVSHKKYVRMVNVSNPNKSDKESEFVKIPGKIFACEGLWIVLAESLTSFDIFFHILFKLFALQPKPNEDQHGYYLSKPYFNNQKQSVCIHIIYIVVDTLTLSMKMSGIQKSFAWVGVRIA